MLRKPGLILQLLIIHGFLCISMSLLVVLLWFLATERVLSLWLPVLSSLLLIAVVGFSWKKIVLPYKETEKLLVLFAAGYTLEGVYDIRYPYSAGMRDTLVRLNELLQTRDLLQASKRQEQYLALQNQINPHFLYNTLEGIRSEALSAGVHSIAEMTEALSSFFRYTISTMDNLVTVEDELGNIETYFLIQQYRFGSRLQLSIHVDENERREIYACRLPKLILQPIVENSILHGLERKIGEGLLRVQLETTAKRLIITISDNGIGMTGEELEELNRNLAIRSLSHVSGGRSKSGIALVNVNNRIKLLFGEQYGVTITSTPYVGTDVELVLPRITGEEPGA